MKALKHIFLVLLIPAALVAIAAARSGAGFSDVLSVFRKQPAPFSAQLFVALFGVFLITVGFAIAGAVVRWLMRRLEGEGGERFRIDPSAEGLIAGLLLVGLALGHTSSRTYVSDDSACRIEIRRLSWIEAPLGSDGSSDCFDPVSITYRDNQGRFIEEKASEHESDYPGESPCNRTILWSTNGAVRAIVNLYESGPWHFYPDPVEGFDPYPPEPVLAAYLRGEPVEVVNQMLQEANHE